jgi:hypothetical protein
VSVESRLADARSYGDLTAFVDMPVVKAEQGDSRKVDVALGNAAVSGENSTASQALSLSNLTLAVGLKVSAKLVSVRPASITTARTPSTDTANDDNLSLTPSSLSLAFEPASPIPSLRSPAI